MQKWVSKKHEDVNIGTNIPTILKMDVISENHEMAISFAFLPNWSVFTDFEVPCYFLCSQTSQYNSNTCLITTTLYSPMHIENNDKIRVLPSKSCFRQFSLT